MMMHNDDGRSIAATQRLIKKRMISVSKSVFALHRMRGICAFSGALPFSSSSRRPRLRKTALRRRPNDEQRNRFMKRGQLCNDDRKSSVQDVPSLAMVKSMPVSYQSMDNISLATLGAMGNYAALQEMLKRHIMATDGVSYQEATDIYAKIEKKNFEYEHVMAFPFQAGIVTCFAAGCISIPLVFYLPAVEFFNEHFVTAEHPPTKELETWLEVGSWSWNWMEPGKSGAMHVARLLSFVL